MRCYYFVRSSPARLNIPTTNPQEPGVRGYRKDIRTDLLLIWDPCPLSKEGKFCLSHNTCQRDHVCQCTYLWLNSFMTWRIKVSLGSVSSWRGDQSTRLKIWEWPTGPGSNPRGLFFTEFLFWFLLNGCVIPQTILIYLVIPFAVTFIKKNLWLAIFSSG